MAIDGRTLVAKTRKRCWTTSTGELKTAWVVDYFDQNRKRHVKTFKTRKAADDWLHQTVIDVKEGKHTAERYSISVAQALDLWVESRRLLKRERATIANCELYAHQVKQQLGALKLAHLTTPRIVKFRDDLLRNNTSEVHTRRLVSVVKSVLSEMQARGLVGHNVALPVKVEHNTRDKARLQIGVDIPTREEVGKLLAATSGRWHAYLAVSVFAGLRASETRGLRWDAIDFDKRTLTVRQRADRFGTIGSPKSSAGRRVIPMVSILLNTLRQWKLLQGSTPNPLGLVFPSASGSTLLHANVCRDVFYPLQQKMGLVNEHGKARYNFHALRHFYASHLIDLGFQPKRVQEWMGHSSIVITLSTYSHLFPSTEDEHDKLEKGGLLIVSGG